MAVPDFTGMGGALPGYGDQRAVELLVFKEGIGYDPAILTVSISAR